MPAYFLDSSAVVKRYVREVGTVWTIRLFRQTPPNAFYVARITSAEVVSAFARRLRGKSLTARQTDKAPARFRRDFQRRFFKIDADATLIEKATDLADKHALRGYDAIQLAAALTANNARIAISTSALIFVCADDALRNAAQAEGLLVDNPNLHP